MNGKGSQMKEVASVAKPLCNTQGTEHNLYALIGKVSSALCDVGLENLAREFVHRSMSANTYDDVLVLSEDYVQFEERTVH